MIDVRARAIVIDIEGTAGSIAFVRDVLFPYADEHLDAFVARHRDEPEVRRWMTEAAREGGIAADETATLAMLHGWMRDDRKSTALKALQGMIWAQGFTHSGVRGHLYDDAVAALRDWHAAGFPLYVYSSGSVQAQKLLFGHSVAGDLLPLFSGFFDTTIGSKREAASYASIAREIGEAAGAVVFFSDIEAELDAARAAGMQAIQVARKSDGTLPSRVHQVIGGLDEVRLLR